MEPLFINKELKFEKTASVYLDKDSSTWVKTIVTEFLTEFPQLQNQPINITWQKKDTSKGYAVGALSVAGGSIPLIVNSFQLSPFDVIMYGQVAIPFTQETVQEMLSSNNAFRGATAVTPKTSLDLFGDGKVEYSPTDRVGTIGENNGIIRDAVKVASFIQRAKTTDKETLQKFANFMRENVELMQNFEKNNTFDVFSHLTELALVDKSYILKEASSKYPINRVYSYKDEHGNTIVKMANAKLDQVITKKLKAGESAPENQYNEAIPAIVKEAKCEDTEVPIKKGQSGKFKDKSGKKSNEMTIVDVKSKKPLEKTAMFSLFDSNLSIILDNDKNYTITSSDFVKNAHVVNDIQGEVPEIGDFGVFIVNDKATAPFSITGMQKVAQYFEISGDTAKHEVKYYPIRVESNQLFVHETEKNAFYVPKNAIFVKLGRFIDLNPTKLANLVENSDKEVKHELVVLEGLLPKTYRIADVPESDFENGIISKYASFVEENLEKHANFNINPVVTRYTGETYAIKATDFTKLGSLHETIWDLIHFGALKEDIEEVQKLAEQKSYKLKVNLELPGSVEVLEKTAEKLAFSPENVPFSPELIKIAAAFTDKTTVDAVLSLNLLKKYNIIEFIQMIPDYERVAGELAKLLVLVRLGLTSMNESVLKTAMESLTLVITLLKRIQKINNSQNK